MPKMSGGWEQRALDWLAWARTTGHDEYWDYREAFFALLPPPAGRALDVGCGEGRVSRDLTERGYSVTGLDASKTLVRAAAEHDPAGEYIVGEAEALPFVDEAFGLVVSYNVLMDVEDMPTAVLEASRVTARGGHVCLCVTHPLADAGEWEHEGPRARFVLNRSYLRGGPFRASVRRDGLRMTFDGSTYSLESYARALQAAGLLIEAVREPAAEDANTKWAHVPMFLMLRCHKPAPAAM